MEPTPSIRISECHQDLKRKRPPYQEEEEDFPKKKVDIKIHDVALEKILMRHFGVLSGRFVATAGPRVLFSIFPQIFPLFPKKKKFFENPKLIEDSYTPKSPPFIKKQSIRSNEKAFPPIGIVGGENNNWINALMQFIIFIPRIRDMFDYAPKSLTYFNIFIDQYLLDQQKNLYITKASSKLLSEFIFQNATDIIFSNSAIDLYQVLLLLMQMVRGNADDLFIDSIDSPYDLFALHPQWQIQYLDPNVSIEKTIENHISHLAKKLDNYSLPPELLFSFSHFYYQKKQANILKKHGTPKSQYIFLHDLVEPTCYDLDAFIEYRPDGRGSSGTYFTYLKVEGSWYQCNDMRIVPLLSNNLKIAKARGFCFHYKRIPLQTIRSKKFV